MGEEKGREGAGSHSTTILVVWSHYPALEVSPPGQESRQMAWEERPGHLWTGRMRLMIMVCMCTVIQAAPSFCGVESGNEAQIACMCVCVCVCVYVGQFTR